MGTRRCCGRDKSQVMSCHSAWGCNGREVGNKGFGRRTVVIADVKICLDVATYITRSRLQQTECNIGRIYQLGLSIIHKLGLILFLFSPGRYMYVAL